MLIPFRKENARAPAVRDAPGAELDRELAERISKGDKAALARLLDRHMTPVHRYLARRLGPGHGDLIAEVVRATFEVALRRLGPYSRGTAKTPMRLWLLRLTNRHLARRRLRARIKAVPRGEGVESAALEKMRKVMVELPPRSQEVVALALFEEMTPGEMAAAMGVSPARAMRQLRSALKRIAQEDYNPDDADRYV